LEVQPIDLVRVEDGVEELVVVFAGRRPATLQKSLQKARRERESDEDLWPAEMK
jgi:hypothetical protein